MTAPIPQSTYRPRPRPRHDPILILRPEGAILRELEEIALAAEKAERHD